MSIKSPLSRQFGSRFDSVFDVVKSNPVYDKAGRIPTLDLNFAKSKSLYDGRSTKNLIDHVRDTAPNSSTYVDAAGLIKRSVTNLMSYSEDFSTTWTQTNATVSTNQIAAPDGNITADKITESIDTGFHRVNQGFSHTNGKTYVGSAFVKAGERTKVHLQLGSNLFKLSLFDLSAGTASGDGVIEDVGNGWYRCSLASTATTTNIASLFVEITNDAGGRNYEGDGTSGLYVWGAQVEEASTAGEYVKTTATRSSAPRFDHDPVTGESLGLLVEESRENIMTYSAVTTSNWTSGGATLTDLSLNALGVFPGVRSASQGQVYQGVNSPAVTLTDGTTYTVTFWFRAGDVNPSNMVRFLLRNDTDGKVSTIIKLSTSTNYEDVSAYSQSEGTTGAPTNVTILSVQKLSDGLTYKMSVSFDAVGVDKSHYFGIHANSEVSGESVIALGLQLEEGSFPTSYIPTEGAAVTRGEDSASISGTNFSSFYNQSEGTLLTAGITPPGRSGFPTLNSFNDGTSNNRIGQYVYTNGFYSTTRVGGAQQGDNKASTVTPTDGSEYKFNTAFAVDNSVSAANGLIGTVDDECLIPTGVNTAIIGASWQSTSQINSTISRLTYWDTRLSNEKLQSTTA